VVAPIEVGVLARKGSLFLTRPTLGAYTAKKEDLIQTANELFNVVKKGIVKVSVNQTYPLKDAARGHQDLESRKTTGSTLFLP
jgi:NADPH2:quinone reductase